MKSLFGYLISILTIFFIVFNPKNVTATAPEFENNIFGIHLAQPDNKAIQDAFNLVNSNGGDWGYITLVIQENDLNKNKWQEIFDKLREKHLIPIIRLATQPEGENWRRPNKKDIPRWVDFLDSLNWVVENRYVVLFNEPNHATEWGGAVDPKNFAQITLELAKKLKEKNSDFFLMMAGLDASAPHSPPQYWDEEIFLNELFKEIKPDEFNNLFSGWASHSYPNPDFSGSPYDYGRGTIHTYLWEVNLLKSFGIKELPVFITETGWRLGKRLNEETVANYFTYAFNLWQQDKNIWAVTPFILNYQQPPFLGFSWQRQNTEDFYLHYYTVQNLPKTKGAPPQIEKGEIKFNLPKELVAQSEYRFSIKLKNQGQSIWDNKENYYLSITPKPDILSIDFEKIKAIKPNEEKNIFFSLKTKNVQSNVSFQFQLFKKEKKILNSIQWNFAIVPLPSLTIEINYWPFGKGDGEGEIQIFDTNEKLVFKTKVVDIKKGKKEINNIHNVALDELYRIVFLKKGYLPRQSYFVFKKEDNYLKFKPLLPFDKNGDGKFSLDDVFSLFKKQSNQI
jgi:hypothetical protein